MYIELRQILLKIMKQFQQCNMRSPKRFQWKLQYAFGKYLIHYFAFQGFLPHSHIKQVFIAHNISLLVWEKPVCGLWQNCLPWSPIQLFWLTLTLWHLPSKTNKQGVLNKVCSLKEEDSIIYKMSHKKSI